MKVIFLDIDGVLLPIPEGMTPGALRWRNARVSFDNPCTKNLAALVHETGAKLVLASNWRRIQSPADAAARENLDRQLAAFGLAIFDETPILSMDRFVRGAEISQWLEAHPDTERFCILDDADTGVFAERTVLCNGNQGFTETELDRARALLVES